mgnify:CR=1 FL=1
MNNNKIAKKKEKKAVVTLQLVNRGGRKFVTVVTGLESFGFIYFIFIILFYQTKTKLKLN